MQSLNENRRIHSIDAMRGFALFGILIVNFLSFHSPYTHIDPFNYWDKAGDSTVFPIIDVFFQASFYPLFSLLFGYGVMILKERAELKGVHSPLLLARRFLFLLIIGLCHALFIWHGDILVTYAIAGFALILFIELSGKLLILLGLLIYIIPNLLLVGILLLTLFIEPDLSAMMTTSVADIVQVYQSGTWLEIVRQNIDDWLMNNNLATMPILMISILPLFLIGAGLRKLQVVEKLEQRRMTAIVLMIVFLTTGYLIKLLPYFISTNLAMQYIQDIFGGPLVAVGYSLLILVLVNSKIGIITKPLQTIGRLSMTNYLMQSIVATCLFYSYGFGLYGNVSLLTGTMIAIILYVCQILFSIIWMKYFVYGPFEWCWRWFTYWQKPSTFKRIQK
ncbi:MULTISPECIES: DUF418 domain-containing protein [Cytobacillus]|uniref:DUF418 domain-containing protein n=1 Tax=Cytobacillus kochii TaxID=859143 RepID=A0A248TDQ2_9BACI|nr:MULTISPECIES: DUF418 domain-containing protein [Cytobacillus]ASV66272.1 hypothetical protein CKF48_02330 [Cytobacillus kochii]MEA1851613.1 DUF418 domain-containing protein [Cytobacillus sp. OWB-43]